MLSLEQGNLTPKKTGHFMRFWPLLLLIILFYFSVCLFVCLHITLCAYCVLLISKRIPITTKAKIYGLECATSIRTSITKLETFHNHIMRFITGRRLQDHVTIGSLRSKMKLKPISCYQREKAKMFWPYQTINNRTT